MPAGGLMTAAIAAPIVMGAIGAMSASGDREAAEKAANEAYALISQINAPPDLSQKILYQKFQQAGILTPEMRNAIDAGASKVAQIKEDPALRNSQMSALQILSQRAQGGLTGQDRANLNEARSKANSDTQGRLQSIIQNMQARGQSGGGAELAAQLSASQNGAQIASKQSDDIMAQASQNALQAASQYGNMAGNVRGQDFSNANTKAQAQDEFSRFNTNNQQNVNNSNADTRNQAAASNLNASQSISNANTQQGNAELLRQQEAKRQYWQDQLALAQTKANAKLGQSGFYQGQGDRTANMWSGMGAAVGQGAGAAAGYSMGKPSTPSGSKMSTTLNPVMGENPNDYGNHYKA